MIKNLLTGLLLIYFSLPNLSNAYDPELGETIQIYTHFSSFIGKPSWLLMIRDIDSNENIPYIYDITRGDDYWLAFTYSRNYLITASTLTFETYQSRWNLYKKYKIKNFCQLESNGRIIRGESIYIILSGELSPDTNTFSCNVSQFKTGNFSIANSVLTQ